MPVVGQAKKAKDSIKHVISKVKLKGTCLLSAQLVSKRGSSLALVVFYPRLHAYQAIHTAIQYTIVYKLGINYSLLGLYSLGQSRMSQECNTTHGERVLTG